MDVRKEIQNQKFREISNLSKFCYVLIFVISNTWVWQGFFNWKFFIKQELQMVTILTLFLASVLGIVLWNWEFWKLLKAMHVSVKKILLGNKNFCLKGIKFKIKCALTKQDTFKGWNELQVFARSKVMHPILNLGMSAIYLNYV